MTLQFRFEILFLVSFLLTHASWSFRDFVLLQDRQICTDMRMGEIIKEMSIVDTSTEKGQQKYAVLERTMNILNNQYIDLSDTMDELYEQLKSETGHDFNYAEFLQYHKKEVEYNFRRGMSSLWTRGIEPRYYQFWFGALRKIDISSDDEWEKLKREEPMDCSVHASKLIDEIRRKFLKDSMELQKRIDDLEIAISLSLLLDARKHLDDPLQNAIGQFIREVNPPVESIHQQIS